MQMPTDGNRFQKKSLCVRMRSSLTKRAPNMKTPGYRVRSIRSGKIFVELLLKSSSLYKSLANVVGYIRIFVDHHIMVIIS